MASGSFSTDWENYYTNSADPGGPAAHYGKWAGSWYTEVLNGVTRLTVSVSAGMYITGNGSGSGYFASGDAISAAPSGGASTGLTSNSNYQWGFRITGYDVGGGHTMDSGWMRVNHDFGEGAPGYSDSYVFTWDYTVGGNYSIHFDNLTIDSPNHAHTVNETDSTINIAVVVEDPDYRPGQRMVSGSWQSHDRSAGACNRMHNGAWLEMRTKNGGSATDDPPRIRNNGWINQKKIGAE